MGRQSLEALPCLHIPYPHTFIKLKVRQDIKVTLQKQSSNSVIPETQNLPPPRSQTAYPNQAPEYDTVHITLGGETHALTDPETMRLDWGLKLQQKT